MFVSSKKSALAGLAGLAMIALSAGTAHAQLTVAGNTTGSSLSGTTGGLVFTPSTFSVTTVNGFAAIGGATENLGLFSLPLSTTTTNINGMFNLVVNFTAPTGTSPNPLAQMATVTGAVSSTAGGAFIDFTNTPTLITFTQFGGGSFFFSVDDVSVEAGNAGATLTGRITGANVIPEPGTMTLLGMGALGALGMVRRRRSAK